MRIVDAKSLGQAVRKRRKELGYTQEQLAGFCGCSTPYLSALENGKETAELGRALRIVNTLGLDLHVMRRSGGEL